MRKIIIDCDPGHDDVMAILTCLAHPEAFEILGICTVAGNQTMEKVTKNILKVEDYFGLDIPVYKGEAAPLVKAPEPQPAAHGESGMDGPVLPEPQRTVEDKDALTFYKETLEKEDSVTIIALAPLTNIALLIKNYPELVNKIDCISLMGGSVYSGNIQKRSEFNIYHDPEAARIVFDSGVRVIMAGLEVCAAGSILLSEAAEFKNGGYASKLCFDLMEFYKLYAVKRGFDRTPIFDLTPVIYLLKPEIFKAEEMRVYIELDGEYCRGMTVCDKEKENPHLVLLDTDREKFIEVFLDALKILDEKYLA